ncbi:unnamed protein product [Phaedon cochleariae]|nr:unnamed protein product [Phaedon cochleariae]
MAEVYDKVGNLHVTAVTTEDTVTPLYSVREGECDKSYGIHCARMVGFPNDVIEDALKYQRKLEHHSGMKLINDFEHDVKRKIVEEGEICVKETIKKVKSMDINSLSDDDLFRKLQEMKSELEKKDNLFVRGLLSN